MTRPTTSPPGRLTLKQAALRSKLSYGQVYRRCVTNADVPCRREDDGSYTVAASDVHLLRPYEAKVDDRPGVTLKVSHEEWARWKRAAGQLTVGQWLLSLARAVTGDV